MVQARCEQSAVEWCRLTYDEMPANGSTTPVSFVGVGWCLVLGWVCKPEVAGSIPARSISKEWPLCRGVFADVAMLGNTRASAVRADPVDFVSGGVE